MDTIAETTVDGTTVKLVRERAPPDKDATYMYRVQRPGNTNIVTPIYGDIDQAKSEYRAVVQSYKENGVPGNSGGGMDGGESSGNFATGFSNKVNSVVKGSGGDSGSGKIQQFATSFSTKVNETVKGSGGSTDSDADDAGGGLGALFGGGMDSDDGDGPMLPGFGGGMDADDSDGGPMLPGMNGGDSEGGPMMPDFGRMDGDGDGDGGPQLAGFGMWDDADNDDDGDNDYNFPGF